VVPSEWEPEVSSLLLRGNDCVEVARVTTQKQTAVNKNLFSLILSMLGVDKFMSAQEAGGDVPKSFGAVETARKNSIIKELFNSHQFFATT
jgi:hypothetical protein